MYRKTKNILIAVLSFFAVLFAAVAVLTGTQTVGVFAEGATAEISDAYVTLNENIVVNFLTKNVAAEVATMRFEYKGKTYERQATVTDGNAKFSFDEVTPQYLGENIKSELVVEGQVVDTLETFSVKSYCERLLSSTAETLGQSAPENAAMRTLLVDMLYYGTSAQNYTGVNAESPATGGLSEADKALKTAYTPLTEGDRTLTGSPSDQFYWKGAGLRFDYNVSLYFTIAVSSEISDLSLDVNGTKITEFTTEAGEGVAYYTAYYTAVGATDFDKVYTATVYEGETAIGKVATYSVKSYVYAMQDDAEMSDLVQTAYNYGKSAAAYAKSVHSLLVSGATTEYTEGDYFVTENMVVQTKAVDGTLTEVSDYDYSVKTALTTDVTEVVITYGGVSVSVPVTVNPCSVHIASTENQVYRMEAEDADMSGMKLSDTNSFIATDGGSGGKYLSNFWAQRGSMEYRIYSEVTGKVSIFFVTGHVSDFTVSDALTLAWNGEEFATSAVAAKTGGYTTFAATYVATVYLQEGINTLKITKKDNFANFDCIDFDVNNPAYMYSVRIDSTENNVYRIEAEDADLSTYELPSWAAGKPKVESGTSASGGKLLGNLSNASGYIEYSLYSEVEGKLSIILWMATMVESTNMGRVLTYTWNGEKFTTDTVFTSTGGWTTFKEAYIATVPLTAGVNTLKLTLSGVVPNFDCIDFEVNSPKYTSDVRMTDGATSWKAEAEKCTVAGTPANGKTSFFEGAGTYLCNLGETGNTVTVTIWSDTARTVSVAMSAAHAYGLDWSASSMFGATLNGAAVSLGGTFTSTGWTAFRSVDLANIDLQQGVNTLVFTVKEAHVPNIDAFIFTAV